jgi:hypothetical protein
VFVESMGFSPFVCSRREVARKKSGWHNEDGGKRPYGAEIREAERDDF